MVDARVRNGEERQTRSPRGRVPTAALTAVAEDLAGELSLRPLLERILRRSTELLGCDAGSICLVDEAAGVYRKEADIGVACQSGQVFPLNEGVTGAIVARGGPVIFEDYGQVPGGHVRPEDRGTLKGVIGVPIRWRGDIVGACVVFTRDPRRIFTSEDAELLEMFAKHAAIAITNARLHEAARRPLEPSGDRRRNRMARGARYRGGDSRRCCSSSGRARCHRGGTGGRGVGDRRAAPPRARSRDAAQRARARALAARGPLARALDLEQRGRTARASRTSGS
jgi:transcriptional regulator with GAF, ATPase, and Fis domain